jgi:hypothetical protein
MTLKSALQDVKETTLSAISGLLARLAYLGSLRRTHGHYNHWGMELVHGREATEKALKTAHSELLGRVLRTPLALLEQDLRESSEFSGKGPREFAEEMQGRLEELVPDSRESAPSSLHLNSVLLALSSLERSRERATRSTS